jgi:hypothetical protein
VLSTNLNDILLYHHEPMNNAYGERHDYRSIYVEVLTTMMLATYIDDTMILRHDHLLLTTTTFFVLELSGGCVAEYGKRNDSDPTPDNRFAQNFRNNEKKCSMLINFAIINKIVLYMGCGCNAELAELSTIVKEYI